MSNKFFQNEEFKKVLLSRAKSKHNSICVSGEDIDGVHHKYSSDYLKWNITAMWARVAHYLSEEERTQWFIDNLPPENKFKQNP